jgi:phosphatidylserine synthase
MVQQKKSERTAAAVADGLTATRLLLAALLLAVVAAGAYALATAVLVAAWWTDFFDGRLARMAPGKTRLGTWDPFADAAVAAAILVGLVSAGVVNVVPWGILGAVLGLAFVVSGNLAWCMLLQALAYELFLMRLWINTPWWLALPVATALVLLVVNRRRFFGELLPTFFAGVGAPRVASALAGSRWR